MLDLTVDAANAVAATVLFRGTAIAVLGWMITRLYSKRASLVSRSWQVAIGSLLVVPLLSGLLPVLTVSTLALDHALLTRTVLGFSFAAWFVMVWAAGVLAHLVRLVLDLRAAARVVAAGQPEPDERVRRMFDVARQAAGVTRPIVLVRANELTTPAVFGWRKPVLLLPPALAAWRNTELRAAFQHELAHIGRQDFGLAVAGSIVRALYWPNPLVRRLIRAALVTTEVACDDAALQTGVAPDAYAARLVAVARATRRAAVLQLALPFAGACGLRDRVAAVMDPARDRRPARARDLVFAVVLAVPLLLGVAMVRGWSCDPAPATTESCLL